MCTMISVFVPRTADVDGREQMTLASLEPPALARLEEGVIYEFVTGR